LVMAECSADHAQASWRSLSRKVSKGVEGCRGRRESSKLSNCVESGVRLCKMGLRKIMRAETQRLLEKPRQLRLRVL
jgi:hypothetical protein